MRKTVSLVLAICGTLLLLLLASDLDGAAQPPLLGLLMGAPPPPPTTITILTTQLHVTGATGLLDEVNSWERASFVV